MVHLARTLNRDSRTPLTLQTTIDATAVEPSGPEILYRSDHVEVRRVLAADRGCMVVTFESYHDDPGFGRSGFGQNFFQREGVSAVHVLTADNAWFQYAELDAVLAAVRAGVSGAHHVLAYGSSMGGYAAIRFADGIGATHVLALSPQYSIDRRRVPRERRWWREQTSIAFLPEVNGTISCAADVVVAYDPMLALDRHHADLIARDVPVRHLRLPHGGHPVAPFLNEVGLLRPLALGFARGPIDVDAIAAEAAKRAETSASWLIERSSRLSLGRAGGGLDLARRALEIAPANETVLYQYGMRLHEARDYRAAVEIHRRAVALKPHAGFRIALSKALFFAGEWEEARCVAEEAVRQAPFEHTYVRWLGRVHADLGRHEAAARDYALVFRIRPSLRSLAGTIRRHVRLWVERARARLAASGRPPDAG